MKVFVYGTLRAGQYNHPLMGDAIKLGNVSTAGRLWLRRGLPMAEATPDSVIQGELYEVTPEQLEHLDSLESHPNWYERQPVQVFLTDAEVSASCQAWCYFMRPDRLAAYRDKELVVSGDFCNQKGTVA